MISPLRNCGVRRVPNVARYLREEQLEKKREIAGETCSCRDVVDNSSVRVL